MTFIDLYDRSTYSLHDMKDIWADGRKEDTENFRETFTEDLLEVMYATAKGRNDLDIIGMTPKEITNYIERLNRMLPN